MTAKFLILYSICGIYLNRATADCSNIYSGTPTFMDCRYRCHCKNDVRCDQQTGSCSNGCEFGWMGPGCQYRNIAKYKEGARVIGSANVPADWAPEAVDGDIQTCCKSNPDHTAGLQWWRIEWSRDYLVKGLVLKLPADSLDEFRSFRVETGTGPSNSDFVKLCYQHTDSPGSVEIEIMCQQSVRTRHLRVILAAPDVPIRLCEVEVYGGRQASFNMETEQSSTYQTFYSFKSVDGHDLSQFPGNDTDLEPATVETCSATAGDEMNPWWYVNLGKSFDIEDIYFFGRRDQELQFQNYTISVGNSSDITTDIFQDDGVGTAVNDYQPKMTQMLHIERGQFLKVERRLNEAHLLTICEVFVFADCPIPSCGWNCSLRCYCQGVVTGNMKIEGLCPDSCLPGWTGNDAKCDTGCEDNTYGIDCSYNCGNCRNNSRCDIITGLCPDGCDDGWHLGYCKTACEVGTYGFNCSETCGKCANTVGCNHVNGQCESGCETGYNGSLCKEECTYGTYGQNCSNKCGNCLNNEACNHVTGICESGCQACSISNESQHDSQGLSFVVGVLVGAVSALCFVGMAGALRWVVILRGRKARKPDRNVYSNAECNGTTEDSPNYDVLDHSDTNKDLGIYYSEVREHQSENDSR